MVPGLIRRQVIVGYDGLKESTAYGTDRVDPVVSRYIRIIEVGFPIDGVPGCRSLPFLVHDRTKRF